MHAGMQRQAGNSRPFPFPVVHLAGGFPGVLGHHHLHARRRLTASSGFLAGQPMQNGSMMTLRSQVCEASLHGLPPPTNLPGHKWQAVSHDCLCNAARLSDLLPLSRHPELAEIIESRCQRWQKHADDLRPQGTKHCWTSHCLDRLPPTGSQNGPPHRQGCYKYRCASAASRAQLGRTEISRPPKFLAVQAVHGILGIPLVHELHEAKAPRPPATPTGLQPDAGAGAQEITICRCFMNGAGAHH